MSDESIDAATIVLQETLGISRNAWLNGAYPIRPVEHLFFTEVYEIGLHEGRLERYPEIKEYKGIFPKEFIEFKYQEASSSPEFIKYKNSYYAALLKEDDVLYIRRSSIYLMHNALMQRDFGDFFLAIGSDCHGLTKEAERYLEGQLSLTRFKNDDQADQYLLELKDLCSSESVRQGVLHHLMGLGVSPLNILPVTRCVEIANKFSILSGVSVDDVLELAAQDNLEQISSTETSTNGGRNKHVTRHQPSDADDDIPF